MLQSNVAQVGVHYFGSQLGAPLAMDGASGNARQGSGGSNGSGSGSGGNNGQGNAQSVRHADNSNVGNVIGQHKRSLCVPSTTACRSLERRIAINRLLCRPVHIALCESYPPTCYNRSGHVPSSRLTHCHSYRSAFVPIVPSLPHSGASVPPSSTGNGELWAVQPPAKVARSNSSQPSTQSTRGAVTHSGSQLVCGAMPWATPTGLNGPLLPPALAHLPPHIAMAMLQGHTAPPQVQPQLPVHAKQSAPMVAPPPLAPVAPQKPQKQQQQYALMAALTQQLQAQPQAQQSAPMSAQLGGAQQQPWTSPMLNMQALSAMIADPAVVAQVLQQQPAYGSMLDGFALGTDGTNKAPSCPAVNPAAQNPQRQQI